MKNICLFCGSSSGNIPELVELSQNFGQSLAEKGHGLVYGGASIGLMGEFAQAGLDAGGKVYGVIPKQLHEIEIAHSGLTELHVVDGMHQRKEKMYQMSDAFVTFPGGVGTLDELCEIFTWAQLGLHQKPIFIFNYKGFFQGLVDHLKHAHESGFISAEHMGLYKEVTSLEGLLSQIDLI